MKKLVLNVAVAAVMTAAQANAATPVPLTAAGTPDWSKIAAGSYSETFITGSSSVTPFLEQALSATCSGTIYKYSFSGSSAYLCSNSGTVAGLTSQYLLTHKHDRGGSINAINAAKGAGQQFLAVSSLSAATACATPTLSVSACTGAYALNPTLLSSDLNYADVDPAQFNSPLNGGIYNTSAGVTATPVATQVFGVAVSLKLRKAMQASAITAGVMPAYCALPAYVETEACMPSLTTAQITTIFARNGFSDWSNIANSPTDATGTGYIYNWNDKTAPGNSNIHICAPTAGSGAWAAFNIKFENAPCFGLSQAFQTASTAAIGQETAGLVPGGEKIIHANYSSADVEDCFAALDSGAASGTFTPYPAMNNANAVSAANNYRWAIGVMGVGRNTTGSKPYRFIKIDNASPSAHNVAEGRYKLWAEMVQVGAAPSNALAGQLNKTLSNPLTIAKLNVTQTWGGVTGLLGSAINPDITQLPTSYTPAANGSATLLNGAFDVNRPVNNYTHALDNGATVSLNHCRLPAIPAGYAVVMPAFYPTY